MQHKCVFARTFEIIMKGGFDHVDRTTYGCLSIKCGSEERN